MSTAAAGVYAGVAETPFAFVAVRAFPEAGIGEGVAYVAEHAGLKALRGIVGCETFGASWGGGLDRIFAGRKVPVAI